MDARVWDNGCFGGGHRFIAPPVSPAQARIQRKALAVVLAKPGDRLLDDAGLTREAAEAIMAAGNWRALIARCLSFRPHRSARPPRHAFVGSRGMD